MTTAPVPELGELKPAADIARELRGDSEDSTAAEAKADPRDSVTYDFSIDHTDPRGKRRQGKFTNRILSIGDRRLKGITKARLSGGMPVAALDADVWEMNEMLAHMAVSLDSSGSNFPKWAENLEDLFDDDLLAKLYEEVASHEARFHRRESTNPASAGVGKDGNR